MPTTYIPCEDCTLSLRDYTLKEMWHAFCNDSSPEKPYSIILGDCFLLEARLSILQRDGYIVSHEVPDDVYVIKVLGFHDRTNIICIGKH